MKWIRVLSLFATLIIATDSKVIGAQKKKRIPRDLPMQVLIIASARENSSRHRNCSGVIVRDYCILTAAHCLIRCTFVRVGYGSIHREALTYVKASKIVQHEHFKNSSINRDNDIALVFLERPIPLDGQRARAAHLLLMPRDRPLRQWGLVAGWRRTSHAAITNDLKRRVVYIYPCGGLVCAATETGEGLCLAESGGVLYVQGEVYAIGTRTTSRRMPYDSFQCVDEFNTDIFTPVNFFANWIIDTADLYKFTHH